MISRTKQGMAVAALLFTCLIDPHTSSAQKSENSKKSEDPQSRSRGDPSKIAASASPALGPTENWIPEDVDRSVPPVVPGVACPLPAVLEGAGQRIKELMQNVDRFTATEVLMHQEFDHSGRVSHAVTVKFDYLVSITQERDGLLGVDELRDRSHSLDRFPSHIATTGTPSLVLIFHPRYINDFRTQCEGLGEWHGQSAWQVRFEQRTDRPGHICSFIVGGKMYNVNLRGRAWILADSFQVARLEADIMESVPDIRLLRNHENIEYRPVNSSNSKLQLWLPSSTELYMDFRGHRYYRKHSFTDFKIFSVDMQYRLGDPKESIEVQ
jgi:hypothetical protein